MIPEEHETQIARQSEAGREMLDVLHRVRGNMTGEQRLAKAFELTAATRQIMRDGIRASHPDWNAAEIQAEHVDRLLRVHGLSLAEVLKRQSAENEQRS